MIRAMVGQRGQSVPKCAGHKHISTELSPATSKAPMGLLDGTHVVHSSWEPKNSVVRASEIVCSYWIRFEKWPLCLFIETCL